MEAIPNPRSRKISLKLGLQAVLSPSANAIVSIRNLPRKLIKQVHRIVQTQPLLNSLSLSVSSISLFGEKKVQNVSANKFIAASSYTA